MLINFYFLYLFIYLFLLTFIYWNVGIKECSRGNESPSRTVKAQKEEEEEE
jgi:hypothetical protein